MYREMLPIRIVNEKTNVSRLPFNDQYGVFSTPVPFIHVRFYFQFDLVGYLSEIYIRLKRTECADTPKPPQKLPLSVFIKKEKKNPNHRPPNR